MTEQRQRFPIFALLIANTISLIGEAMTVIAIPWFVYETTGSATDLGLVAFFTFLPRVLASFLGGTVVDRIGFKSSSILADLLSGLAMAAIPLCHATIGLSFEMLLVLVFVGAFFDGPGSTARESMVPDLVARAGFSLERVNSIYQLVQRLSQFVGPLIVGFAVALIGTTNILWLNAFSFGISIVLIGLFVPVLKTSSEDDELPTLPYWHQLREGFLFIRRDPVLLALAVIIATLNFLDAPLTPVILPVFTREAWNRPEAIGLILAAFGAAAVLSSLVWAAFGQRLPRGHAFVASYLLAAIPFLIWGLLPPLPLAIGVALVLGIATGPLNPIIMTVRQERVPAHMRARVFGIFTSLAWIAIPLGNLLGGFAVAAFGVRTVLLIIGGVYLIVTLIVACSPLVRALERSSAPKSPLPAG